MNYKRYLHDISIALEAIIANKLKSILTALGIIFGVAAVISMLAIGNGAQQEILEQIKLVGINNIIITPAETFQNSDDDNDEGESESKKFSPGLHLKDVEAIKQVIPNIAAVSPEIELTTMAMHAGRKKNTKLIGVNNTYFDVFNHSFEFGKTFNEYQENHGFPVCIIGSGIQDKFFGNTDPVGKKIRCGAIWLTITGVLAKQGSSDDQTKSLKISQPDDKVFIPIQTMLIQYENRGILKPNQGNFVVFDGGSSISFSSGSNKNSKNQLDKIVVQITDSRHINSTIDVIQKLILRRHQGIEDFEISVPELLLKQEQKTKDIFNIVLGAIASISLIVGGIGIMNIMLASVLERIREIGTRQAIGATRKDIVVQFLAESTLISISGGLIGILLGFVFSRLITEFTDILTIIDPVSVLIAFGVSASVGIIFGYMPAKRASEKDPVESLRYE